MFDVKPVDQSGNLDWKKISFVEKRKNKKEIKFKQKENSFKKTTKAYFLGVGVESNKAPFFHDPKFRLEDFGNMEQSKSRVFEDADRACQKNTEQLREIWLKEREKNAYILWNNEKRSNNFFRKIKSSWGNKFFIPNFSFQLSANKAFVGFAAVLLFVSLGFGGLSYASKGVGVKGKVLGVSQDGFSNLTSAISAMADQNFGNSEEQFSLALEKFSKASQQLNDVGGLFLGVTQYIPFTSKISSGKNAVEAGKHFSAAGKSINEVVKVFSEIDNPIKNTGQESTSFLDMFKLIEKNVVEAKKELDAAQKNIDKISVDDLPEDRQNQFLTLKQELPKIRKMLDSFLNNSHIFSDLLGGNGPRKYLFLFQNNSEIRATGGFIGSYGLLDISNGHVKKFFIDGIFNPDGQLKDKIVPPKPIQKVSAAWSLHDSNWFSNFPTSAKKAIYFYEKTGGPTVDGVITFTPTLMQKLLEITGPVDMPEYGVTLDANNFVELTQYEVEADYDKEENKPKKILSDLAPIVLEKLLINKNLQNVSKIANVFSQGLREKHILLYFQNDDLQNIISDMGWSGKIIPAEKDYISVINTNINGYKTDAVVKEKIEHVAEIQADGSIMDTVTITRKHTGGNSDYEWFNKVNANYMRVYVPLGSRLLEVTGQTREINEPPLDYDALNFKKDIDVQKEEKDMTIDSESGTRIYEEEGKTVFANWTYVSPQETMVITYKYLLPFKLFKVSVGESQQVDSYSLVAQKQSGSLGSSFVSQISYPSDYELKWQSSGDFGREENLLKKETVLTSDYFFGLVFKKN